MRETEANKCLASFQNERARVFVNKMMKVNYACGIKAHHPRPDKISHQQVEENCNAMIDEVFARIEKIKDKQDQLFPLFQKLSRNNPEPDRIWFDEILEAYQNYKHQQKLRRMYDQLKDKFVGDSYGDIGCGGGDLVYYIKNHHPDIREAAGIDVMDWRTPAIKEEIGFQQLDFSQPGTTSQKKYDTLTCLAVLHHVGNTDHEMNNFLQNLQTAMHRESRLIIEEDVVIGQDIQHHYVYIKDQLAVLKNQQPLYKEFLNFSEKDQLDIIILIDFLANCIMVGVPEMPFPCGFRSMASWQSLFENNNFELIATEVKGFVVNNFNPSSHVHFVLGMR